MSKVNCVHITLQDFIFGHLLFNLQGKVLLLDLTFQFFRKCIFRYEVREYVVLDQLLGKSTGTLTEVTTVCDTYNEGTQDTLWVNSLMIIETFVLNCDKCML